MRGQRRRRHRLLCGGRPLAGHVRPRPRPALPDSPCTTPIWLATFSSAKRGLYERYLNYQYHLTEGHVYRIFLKHTPPNREAAFLDVYRRAVPGWGLNSAPSSEAYFSGRAIVFLLYGSNVGRRHFKTGRSAEGLGIRDLSQVFTAQCNAIRKIPEFLVQPGYRLCHSWKAGAVHINHLPESSYTGGPLWSSAGLSISSTVSLATRARSLT